MITTPDDPWATPLGGQARDARRMLDDLGDTRAPAVQVSPERLRYWSSLIADLVEAMRDA